MFMKALFVSGVVLGCGLFTLSVPAWGSERNAPGPSIARSADTASPASSFQSSGPAAGLPPITLDEVLTRTLQQNPRLSAYAQEIKAREFEARQTALYPNPEISLEIENVAGSGAYSRTDAAETTVRIGQLFELGGKRARRGELAHLETELAEREYEIVRAEVIAEATTRFVNALAAQRRLLLAREQIDLARRVLNVVEEQVAAGKTADIERIRFKVLVADAHLRERKALQELSAAQHALAGVWGSEVIDFSTLQGSLEKVQDVPDWSELTSRLEGSPRVAFGESAVRGADRTLALAKAGGVPDVTFNLGLKNDADSGDSALVAEVSMALPIFNRNQGALAAASARRAKAEAEAESVFLAVRAELAEGFQKLHAAHGEVTVLAEEILPAIQRSFDAVAYGYQAGKFGFLELLDSERSLFEANSRYVDALTAYHIAVSELELLLGQKIFAEGNISHPVGKERGES